ncbi:MAG: response regulator [Cyanobacteria bacterium RM1_2_2]|nr:response regulator [Cyanobacteria bacterium RM1_2_2]
MQPDPTVNVLLVDDHPENLIALEAILGGLGQNLVRAHSGEEALRCLLDQDFAVILLDVQMPGMDGFETASLIRQRQRSRSTPIIFVTAFDTSDSLMGKGYALGAVDYLFKPIEPTILTSKVAVFVDLFKKTQEVARQATQMAAMNAELQRSEERFRLLSRCSPVGIFLMDTDGRYTYANPNCQAIGGFTMQENWQPDWINRIFEQDRSKVLADWLVAIQQGQAYSDEFRIQTLEEGMKWVHVRTAPMLSDQGDLLGHVGTLEDITDRKQADAVRDQIIREQSARQQAEAANRMKDEFLAIVSHELRTPLNSILGWAQLLLNRKLDEHTTIRALQTIERNARSQAQLIEDILDVSQIIRGRLRLTMQPISIIPLIESAIEIVSPLASDKSIILKCDFDNSVDKVYGDTERLRQIIWNLFSNAIKFTPENGEVTVRLTKITRAEFEISRNLASVEQHTYLHEIEPCLMPEFNATEYAQIQIADTGIGISADFLPHVFDRFRQADSTTTRPYGGLGLGLAIVHHLVQQHQGLIRATSEGEGKGATFTVSLPLLSSAKPEGARLGDGESQAAEPAEQVATTVAMLPEIGQPSGGDHNGKALSLSEIQVLIVEDHHDTRDFLAMVLQASGAEVTAVSSANEAIRHLEHAQPDVLVSDIGLPIEDGYKLIRKVRDSEATQGNHIPAIALTAYVRAEDQLRALSAGFEMHVAKPVEPEELIAAIAQAVGRGS